MSEKVDIRDGRGRKPRGVIGHTIQVTRDVVPQLGEAMESLYRVAKLSVPDLMVRSRTSKQWAATSSWRNPPANSSWELLSVPWGLSKLTSWVEMCCGKEQRQTTGPGVR
eukprot:scaffold3103_cov136-Cylindrotheca_fusiformis.AAC.2